MFIFVRAVVVATILISTLAGGAQAQDAFIEHRGGQPHAEAPAETAQLDFFIGDWIIHTKFAGRNGEDIYVDARMSAQYIMNGFAIEMVWWHPNELFGGPGAIPFMGTTLLMYDAEAKRWTGGSVNSLGNRKFLDGEFKDSKLVLVQSGELFQNRPGKNRLSYFNISTDSFEHTLEHADNDWSPWRATEYSFVAERVRQ